MIAAMRVQTKSQEHRLAQVGRLAKVASDRLVNADRTLRSQVLALLDVHVTVTEHASDDQPVKLLVEGTVADEMLLTSADNDWHLTVGASADG